VKKLGIFLLSVSLTAAISAQDKNMLNHMDVGVNVGTLGVGIDVAVPVGDYVRIRAGYNYMPRITFHSDFPIETSKGGFGQTALKYFNKNKDKVADILSKPPFDQPKYQRYTELFGKLSDVELRDYVTMGLKPTFHQFKFLVDVMPFKNNKHWSFTTGFFVGPSDIGSACNMDKETAILEGVLAYNEMYLEVCSERFPAAQLKVDGIDILEKMKEAGVAGFPLGYFDKENRYKAMMVPGEDATVHAEMEISKIRPYLGVGYNTHLSRNKKWNLNVDAGVLFLCGTPSVYVDNVYCIDVKRETVLKDSYDSEWNNYDVVHPNMSYINYINDGNEPDPNQTFWLYDKDDPSKFRQHVDLVHDLYNMPNGKVRDMVNTISKFKVYPNVSVTFSYRLF